MRDSIMFVLFDVPMGNRTQRKEYTKLTKNLKKNGFQAIQKSIYIKHLRNTVIYKSDVRLLEEISPKKGDVLTFHMSVDQFRAIKSIRGEKIDFSLLCENIIVL